MTHADLIERLKAAECGSRELDAELFWLFDRKGAERCYWNAACGLRGALPDDWNRIPLGLGGFAVVCLAPRYTESVDAALAMAERVLPGWFVGLQQNRGDVPPWSAYLSPPEPREDDIEHDAASPALALCIAILRAKEEGG